MPAAVEYQVRGDVKAITRHLDVTVRKFIPAAVVSSLTGTARAMRKEALAHGRKALSVPARELSKRARIRRATRRKWSAAILVNRGGINPAKVFKIRVVKPAKKKKGSKRKSTKKLGVKAGKHFYEKHFVAKGKHGNGPFIFKRKGKKRFPLVAAKISMDPVLDRFKRLTKTKSGDIFTRLFRQRMKAALNKRGFSEQADLLQ